MMDVLDRTRRIGSHEQIDDDQLQRSRARLEEAFAAEPRRGTRGVWALRVGIGAGALAAAAAAAIVVASWQPRPADPVAVTPEPDPGQTSQPTPTEEPVTATTVLEGAARLAPASVGSVIAMGGYLRVDTRLEQLVLYGAGAEHSPYNATRTEATAGWVAARTYSTYIPADRTQEWVRVYHPDTTLVSTFGTDAERLAAEWLAQIPAEEFAYRTMGGIGEEPSQEIGGTVYASDGYFALMPRDPDALLAWYATRVASDDPSPNGSLFRTIVQDLELNAAPADLRAAMFRALSLVPGVTIASTEGTVVTLALDHQNYGGLWRNTISVDQTTGLVTGSTVTIGAGPGVVPETIPTFRTTTTVTASDTAP